MLLSPAPTAEYLARKAYSFCKLPISDTGRSDNAKLSYVYHRHFMYGCYQNFTRLSEYIIRDIICCPLVLWMTSIDSTDSELYGDLFLSHVWYSWRKVKIEICKDIGIANNHAIR